MPEGIYLILMRHGEAVPYASTDANRALTSRGEQQASAAAKGLQQWLQSQALSPEGFDLCSSVYLRARQTASALGDVLGLKPETRAGVTPEDAPRKSLQHLCRSLEHGISTGRQGLILVSHMPFLASLCALCEGGDLREARGFHLAEQRLLYFPEVVGEGLASRVAQLFPAGP